MPHADAILEDQDGRTVLRFERVLAHPPATVWRALTEKDELRRWHPSPFELASNAVHYMHPDSDTLGEEGVVTDFDPPHLLNYT